MLSPVPTELIASETTEYGSPPKTTQKDHQTDYPSETSVAACITKPSDLRLEAS
jgi:hypothetical protein